MARDERLGGVRPEAGESALLFRAGDDAIVLEVPGADAELASANAGGAPLGVAQASHPRADVVRLLALLLQHGLVTGVQAPARSRHSVQEAPR